jgi:hypothetical protein
MIIHAGVRRTRLSRHLNLIDGEDDVAEEDEQTDAIWLASINS